MHKLNITSPAKQDIQGAFEWWRDNRSAEHAERWYRGVYDAIRSLRKHPERCPKAPEADLLPHGMQQLLFGIGRQCTHRIVFTLAKDVVTVLRVRHTSQDELRLKDVT